MRDKMDGVKDLVLVAISFLLSIFIGLSVLSFIISNATGILSGKGTVNHQLREQQQQIEELQEQLKEAESSSTGISRKQLSELYNKLYLEYISIKSYNEIGSLQEQYTDLQSDEYKQALLDVYNGYEKEIKQMFKDVFDVSDEEIEAATGNQ